MTRLIVIHPYVQTYRHSLYERLSSELGSWDIGLFVVQNEPPPALADRADSTTASWSMPIPTRWLRIRDRDVAVRNLRTLGLGSTDLVIVEQAVKNSETYPLLARKNLGGPSVAMWGHGRSCSTPQGRMLAAAKQFLTRRCDWFFAYTQAGADHVIDHGFPPTRVSVLNNTIDTDTLRRDLDAVSDDAVQAFSRRLGVTPGRTALFLGGVDKAKGIDFLLESAQEAAQILPGFVLLVGGAGAQLADVQGAERAGAPVRALGRLDGLGKALALRASDVLALPSSIGLVAVDSLVAGVPIITRDDRTHGPEADYLVNGATSLWVAADSTSQKYASTLACLLNDEAALHAMQDACAAEAPRYGLDSMVDAFIEGVLAWKDIVDSGL